MYQCEVVNIKYRNKKYLEPKFLYKKEKKLVYDRVELIHEWGCCTLVFKHHFFENASISVQSPKILVEKKKQQEQKSMQSKSDFCKITVHKNYDKKQHCHCLQFCKEIRYFSMSGIES